MDGAIRATAAAIGVEVAAISMVTLASTSRLPTADVYW